MRRNDTVWNTTLFWGIKLWQFASVVLLYTFFGFMYWLSYFILGANNFREMTADYLLKGFLSLPLWYFYFVYLKQTHLVKKLLLHLITWPLFVFAWFHLHHALMRSLGWSYLAGGAAIWDIYLPTLFYIAQFSIYHVYCYWSELIQQKRKEQDLLQSAYQSEINALKAQIQPHFLFNTLNSISASIPPENEKSRILISKLADTFRYSLQASEEETITLEDELRFLSSYLDLEQERFKSRLQVRLTIDKSLLHVRLPPMLLQPLVENAIKHGVSPKAAGGCVHVSVAQDGNMAKFQVKDTGVGCTDVELCHLSGKGIGLRNTSLRIKRLYNEELTCEHNNPTGLTITFRIPIFQRL